MFVLEFTSPIDMVFHERKTSFKQGGRLTFDIEKPGDTLFFSAIGTEELNSVQNILELVFLLLLLFIHVTDIKYIFDAPN